MSIATVVALSNRVLLKMDPLSALSLAACVVQFLDFGSKLVRETKEIAEGGSTVSVEHLSRVTVDLIRFNSALDQQVRFRSSIARVRNEDKVSGLSLTLESSSIDLD